MREKERASDALRAIKITPHFLEYADGSALIEMGKTRILAAATIEEKVPHFLKGSGKGWVTAEYSMLPRATEKRNVRERAQGRLSGRSQEIQRLIGRVLRTITDLSLIGERTIIVDCDVIQADGGTRTASINAGSIALSLSLKTMMDKGIISEMPLHNLAAAVSLGIVQGEMLLDLDYSEDSEAELDMNVVETDNGKIIEIQVTAEKRPFSRKEFNALLKMADKGIEEIIQIQKTVLKKESMLFMAYG
jgi:ribonuclease PH